MPLFQQKHPHGPRIFSEFCICYYIDIFSLLQFIKVKIILENIFESVLFISTTFEAKMWAHFPRYVPAMKKTKHRTIASQVSANHRKHMHIYLRAKYLLYYLYIMFISILH